MYLCDGDGDALSQGKWKDKKFEGPHRNSGGTAIRINDRTMWPFWRTQIAQGLGRERRGGHDINTEEEGLGGEGS